MKYFKVQELVDRNSYQRLGDDAIKLIYPELCIALDDFREFWDRPVLVNDWHNGGRLQWRGYRTPEQAVKEGAKRSAHAFTKINGVWTNVCQAIDCNVHSYDAAFVRKTVLEHKDHPLLQRINRMEAGVAWVHFDLVPVPERITLFSK